MTDDSRLASLWALDEPPAQDPAFVLATLDRLARRRFRMKAARLVPMFVATMAVCWAVAPSVEALLQSNGVAAVIAAAIGFALAAKYASNAAQPELM
jgi:drug/metabolite transporter (DMT)-like permease